MTDRTCAGCAEPLPAPATRERNPRKWCSEACRLDHLRESTSYGDRNRDRNRERAAAQRKARGPVVHHLVCPACSQPFTVNRRRTFCSKRCADVTRQKRHEATGQATRNRNRRRAREAGAFVSDVDRAAVFERDGWSCQLCLDPVDPTLSWPDPRSPSLDHVVPLAAGGTHEPSNVQLAHLRCNLRKGARVAA